MNPESEGASGGQVGVQNEASRGRQGASRQGLGPGPPGRRPPDTPPTGHPTHSEQRLAHPHSIGAYQALTICQDDTAATKL